MNRSTIGLVLLGGVVFMVLAFSKGAGPDHLNDFWIQSALDSVLEKDGDFDLDQVSVVIREGNVRLKGNVLTEEEKGHAEQIAMQIPGVQALENDIHVIPPVNRDVDLEKQIQSEIFENPLLHIRDLRVLSKDGTVTINGIVRTPFEKKLMDSLVLGFPGVKGLREKAEVLFQTPREA